MLPVSILQEAQAELLNWQELGMSVMEVGHRSAPFQALMAKLEADVRALLAVPDTYHVLFLGQSARTQFSMIPMNFLSESARAGYVVSGYWSNAALTEARRLKQVYCVTTTESQGFLKAPLVEDWYVLPDTSYVYYTPNETIHGVRIQDKPSLAGIPLVADMTSCLFSEPVNINDYGLIFAGAQKNLALAGLTLVIIRAEWLAQSHQADLPVMMDYKPQVKAHSLYATPPVFSCYLAEKMLSWLKAQGGIGAFYRRNCEKAACLYQAIDASALYRCAVDPHSRSIMNVCFSLTRPSLEALFLKQAGAAGLVALQGHRIAGGLRASLYNAMPLTGVLALVAFMRAFEEEHGAV